MEFEYVDPEVLLANPAMVPREDLELTRRLKAALDGELEVNMAVLPLGLLVPYDLDLRPDLVPEGRYVIEQIMKNADKGQFVPMIVYQRGYWFIAGDDYPILFAHVRGMPDLVQCVVLGAVDHPLVQQVQPVPPEHVRRALGVG